MQTANTQAMSRNHRIYMAIEEKEELATTRKSNKKLTGTFTSYLKCLAVINQYYSCMLLNKPHPEI